MRLQRPADHITAAGVVAVGAEDANSVHLVGRTEEVREEFYAITVERRITHPAVAASADAARHGIPS